MKKTLIIATIVFTASTLGFAQNRNRYVFDNFSTPKGVEVVKENRSYEPDNRQTTDKKGVAKKSPQKTMSVSDAESLKGSNVKATAVVYSTISMSSGGGMRGFTTGDATVDSYINTSSARYRMDPLLIYAQMSQESAFKKRALSHKGASGLMQLMPPTARRFGVTDIYDPQQNIDAGIKYMRWLLDKFGDIRLALAGYNAGEGAVMKYGNQIPPYKETQEYVRRITARYASIGNPNFVKTVKAVPVSQIAKIENRESAPLTKVETITVAVRLPDGRMRLVNQ
jgi:hypothetical protein